MYDVTEYCLSYTVLVSVVQSGAVVTRSNLSQMYTQHCTDSSRTEFVLEKNNRHQFLVLTGEIWVVCCENLKKIDRVIAVPHCFNPFPVAFGALLWVSLSYDVTNVLMQSSLRTSESDVLCLYVLLCLVVTKKCQYGEIKLCEKKNLPPLSWKQPLLRKTFISDWHYLKKSATHLMPFSTSLVTLPQSEN